MRNLPLLLSLALNLLLAGYVASQWLVRPAEPADHRGAVVIERLASSLPPTDGQRLRAELATRADALAASEAETDGARDGIRAALRREPFDGDALKAAMAEFRAKRGRQQERLQEVIFAAAAAMSPEGRARLADWRPHGKK